MNPLESIESTIPVQQSHRPDVEWEDREKELQFAWIEHVSTLSLEEEGNTYAHVADETSNERMIEMVTSYGEWFRTQILQGKERDYFLQLFVQDREQAFRELDQLWAETAH